MALELNAIEIETGGLAGVGTTTHMSLVEAGGNPFLVAGITESSPTYGPAFSGLAVYAVADDGTLANVDNVIDTDILYLEDRVSVATAQKDGVSYLYAAGDSDDGLSIFTIGSDGALALVGNVGEEPDPDDDDPLFDPQYTGALATASFAQISYLFAAADGGETDLGFVVESDGGLTYDDAIEFEANEISEMIVAGGDGLTHSYLFGADNDRDSVVVFRVTNDGSVTFVDEIDSDDPGVDGEDLVIEDPAALTAAEIGDTTYLFVASDAEVGISVFAVQADGTLTNVDNVTDADDPDLFLYDVDTLTTVLVDGVTYLAAAGDEPGFSVFSVAGDGTLSNVANIAVDDPEGPGPLAAWSVDGTAYLYVGAELAGGHGITTFALGHDIIDETAATVAVAENGTAAVTVDKLYDDDTLTYTITGGDDAALFEIDAATGEVTFLAAPDFETPEDADGDNVYDIEVTADDGIVTEAKTLAIEVTNVGGTTVNGTSADNALAGHGEEDLIKGKGGHDTLNGKGGDDTLRGGNGDDRLKGGSGDDLLSGGKGKDKLTGGDGADAFRFDKALSAGSVDRIKDLETGIDTIQLDNAVFTRIGAAGDLQDRYFDYGDTATSGKDRVLYDPDTGWLRYDADGKGGDDAVKFARLDKRLDISADDFLVV